MRALDGIWMESGWNLGLWNLSPVPGVPMEPSPGNPYTLIASAQSEGKVDFNTWTPRFHHFNTRTVKRRSNGAVLLDS